MENRNTEISSPIRTHALVIGIDNYVNPRDRLRGAVSDATRFAAFITERFGAKVELLVDKQARRRKIIQALETLSHPVDGPPRGAAIIIYFAGHGGRNKVPSTWGIWATAENMVEVICPVDIYQKGANGKLISGISDRTIACLLHEIYRAKGSNITAIFDCCHSGGANRGLEATERHIPTARLPPLDTSSDELIFQRNAPRFGLELGLGRRDQPSHVLLSACRRDQTAKEIRELDGSKRGAFTTALLGVLENEKNLHEISCLALFHKISIPSSLMQNPQCDGRNMYCPIFRCERNGTFFRGHHDPGQTIVVEAGAAHGVKEVSVFAIFADDTRSNKPLGHLVVQSVHGVTSTLRFLQPAFEVPRVFYVELCDPDETITVYCHDDDSFDMICRRRPAAEILQFHRTGDKHHADIEACSEDTRTTFFWPQQNGLSMRIAHSISDAESWKIWNVLRAIYRFNYHRVIQGGSSQLVDTCILIELKRLAMDEQFNVITEGDNILDNTREGVITIGPGNYSDPLRLTFANKGGIPLFLHVFHFAVADLSITPWFSPPLGPDGRNAKVDASLLPGSLFAIGHGDGGSLPIRFYLGDGEESSIAFIKVFLTTQAVAFPHLDQTSPFFMPQSNDVRDLSSSDVPRSARPSTPRLADVIPEQTQDRGGLGHHRPPRPPSPPRSEAPKYHPHMPREFFLNPRNLSDLGTDGMPLSHLWATTTLTIHLRRSTLAGPST